MTEIVMSRVYDEPTPDDGLRWLVDRLWPRGMSKERAALDTWHKDLAPSDDLRRWFHADLEGRWPEFTRRYLAELDANPAADEALTALAGQPRLTLLTAARNLDRSEVPVLRDWLISRSASA
ncbi:DUF488 domain-containing protein [Aestuariimicrobium soli]|uniref:DUF488 domain-containing protein n=1 Tax=Aestuariimicrobium soli TaxID=2035834 RepID=UPI003EB82F47